MSTGGLLLVLIHSLPARDGAVCRGGTGGAERVDRLVVVEEGAIGENANQDHYS